MFTRSRINYLFFNRIRWNSLSAFFRSSLQYQFNRFPQIFTASIQRMELSPIGEIAARYWWEIPNHFHRVELDEFVVMPNHLHGIIVIKCSINYQQTVNCRGVQLNAPTSKPDNYYSRISPQKNTLSVIIRTYKAAVTRWCRNNGFEYFKWQRNYHDHIIRSEKELNAIRQYITDNPLNWQLDSENPHSEN